MKKKFQRISEINLRFKAIADTVKAENRAMTKEEKDEVDVLEREKSFLTLQIAAASGPAEPDPAPVKLRDAMRKVVGEGRQVTLSLREAGAAPAGVMLTGDLNAGSLVPLKVGDIIKPLREDLIYKSVGIQLPTGCSGTYEWPVVEAVKATVAGEGVKVGAKKINLSKVATVTQRIAVGIEATRESLFNSDGKLESIIREQLPAAIADMVNQIVISPEKVTPDCAISGPWTGKTPSAITLDFKALNKAKAALLAKGFKSGRMVWVMTEATKAELEATPKDKGSGIMCIEGGTLCGLPVFCSEHIGEGNIGLGDMTYQVCGQFGDFSLIVDPYTGADAGIVRFWLNADFGTATLRPEAFALYSVTA